MIMKRKGIMKDRRVWHGISHGFYIIERGDQSEGSILAQREQIEDSEFWLFGAFDHDIGDSITTYLRSNIFDKMHNEVDVERKAKEIMKKAYLITAEKEQREEKNEHGGFAAMLVVNGESFVVANFGEYKAVACMDGLATGIDKLHPKERRKWSIKDLWHQIHLKNDGEKPQRSSRLIVKAQKVTTQIEFIILASDGVWEVMNNQEAVDLMRHIEDAQQAAESLAQEVLSRTSNSTISCIVVRFH